MTAGVPGSGIGGFFYLISALLMPVQESVAICRKTSSRSSRQAVCRQVLNAIGVLLGVWLTGWFISRSITVVSSSIHPRHTHAISIINKFNIFYGMITLLAVFLFIQVISVAMRMVPVHSPKASGVK